MSRMNGSGQDGLNFVLDSTQSAKLLQQMLCLTPLVANLAMTLILEPDFSFHFWHCPSLPLKIFLTSQD